MDSLRESIRQIILERCLRPSYWGVGGSGVVVLCSEDNTIFLQKRSLRVSGGAGQWGFPGGGIHIGRNRFYDTPIEDPLDSNDPVFEQMAFEELEEEAGKNGLPKYRLLDSLISYDDCGFKYKTFIIDISLEEKERWEPAPTAGNVWEVDDNGWFDGQTWDQEDIYFGFTPSLISAIKKYVR